MALQASAHLPLLPGRRAPQHPPTMGTWEEWEGLSLMQCSPLPLPSHSATAAPSLGVTLESRSRDPNTSTWGGGGVVG